MTIFILYHPNITFGHGVLKKKWWQRQTTLMKFRWNWIQIKPVFKFVGVYFWYERIFSLLPYFICLSYDLIQVYTTGFCNSYWIYNCLGAVFDNQGLPQSHKRNKKTYQNRTKNSSKSLWSVLTQQLVMYYSLPGKEKRL